MPITGTNTFFVIFTVISISALFYSFFLLDIIFRNLFEKHHDIWEREGKPIGFWWKPPKVEQINLSASDLSKDMMNFIPNVLRGKPFSGKIYQNQGGARTRLAIKLLFKTPDWIKNDKKAKRIIIRMRLFTYLWWIYCITMFFHFAKV